MSSLLDPMAQDEEVEQEMLVVEGQEQFPPQMDPEPEMGTAAAYDTSPPLLHQNPSPIPAETAHRIAPDMAQLFAMLAEMNSKMDGNAQNMNEKMDGNTRRMEGMNARMEGMNAKMDGMARMMREEMQCMGAGLQNGLDKIKEGQEQFKIGQGELLRATCWGRLAEVTEEVTVTQREIRHVEVTEYTETREIGERLHGVEEEEEDAHTHIQVVRDNGGELDERVGTRCEQLGVLPREQGEGVCPLEVGHDQGNSAVPREVEGRSAADGCTQSLYWGV